ncbi:MAG: hypothetical protein QM687_04420 [Ferruginibacter sp.]
MLKKIYPVLTLASLLLYGCGQNDTKPLETKEDSLVFARSIMDKYPQEGLHQQKPADTIPGGKGGTAEKYGFSPISWSTAQSYMANYDKDPQLKSPYGYYYQGFCVDTAGMIILRQTKEIKGLFLRIGKKDNGEYTVMVLGTNASGKIIDTLSKDGDPKGTNFDALDPCPNTCP